LSELHERLPVLQLAGYGCHKMFAPMSLDLKGLFRDPAMFNSSSRWRKAGFSVEGNGVQSDIMVASHPSASGYLFKKYSRKISLKDQRKNYRCRIKGAEKLRELLAAQRLTQIVVPRKHLHELPPEFCHKGVPAYVLIVERLVLLDSTQSKQRYRQIDTETLRQFCTVLRTFRGLDSGVRNVPFTDRGQIAFVDTERWDNEKKGSLRRIHPYLSDERRAFAAAIFNMR
jgi:hypothetical protein